MSEVEAGVNLPPMHPNCRSTTVAVVEKREDEISRFSAEVKAAIEGSFGELSSDAVLLTPETTIHIVERHADIGAYFFKNFGELVNNPDLVLHNKEKKNSIIVFCKYDDGYYTSIPIKLALKGEEYTHNSVATAHKIKNKELERLKN